MQPARLFWKLGHGEEIRLRETDDRLPWIPRTLYQMRCVTLVTADSMQRVRRVREVLLVPAALMASQAALRILLGIPLESEDQLGGGSGFGVIAARGFFSVGVRFGGTVAHLATLDRILRRHVGRRIRRI